ncbi:MAG: T9SS type A sorting domain-containing protein [Chitinophagaceae bacterium]|nr:MAG: T9SS type A sorting domain-containing protein [Chitinophagaceae bacterium]
MKTIFTHKRTRACALVVASFFALSTSFSQSAQGITQSHESNDDDSNVLKSGLVFIDPELKSGADLQKGAVYLFRKVSADLDATVTIEDLVNGARVNKIDDNGGGVGYRDAFQPEVKSGGVIGRSYAQFRVQFYRTGTESIQKVQSLSATALDIDGNLHVKEFADIELGDGAKAQYKGSGLLDISLLNLLLGKFRADNLLGVERDGIDTLAFGNMYTASNDDVSGFVIRYGTTTTVPSNSSRQFSMYMKGFAYPDQVTLPLGLTAFTAELHNTQVDLKWTSSWERNVSYFIVERSQDGKEYKDAGLVFANGSINAAMDYRFTDAAATSGKSNTLYYRLRAVDGDQKVQYSNVRIIHLAPKGQAQLKILTYPNPVTSQLVVTIPDQWQGKKVDYEVLNASGQLALRSQSGSASQSETISVGNLPAGLYVIRVSCDGETGQQKLVKR